MYDPEAFGGAELQKVFSRRDDWNDIKSMYITKVTLVDLGFEFLSFGKETDGHGCGTSGANLHRTVRSREFIRKGWSCTITVIITATHSYKRLYNGKV